MNCEFCDCRDGHLWRSKWRETDGRYSAWMPNTDLTPLDPAECKSLETKGKAKNLLAAYQEAAEHRSLDYYKGLLNEHQAALEADLDTETAQEKKKPKSKRKSVDTSALNDDADQMDVDEEAVASKPKSRKRKKETEVDEAEQKVISPK